MMQKLLIAYLLTPIGRITEKISDKGRDALFLLGGLGLVVHFFAHNMQLDNYRFLVYFAINCVFMGLMLLGSLSGTIHPVKFHKPMAFCWFGAAALTTLSGLTQSSSYLPDGVLMLVILPVLYICWCNQDRQHILGLLLKICRISLMIFLVVSFLLAEITQKKYSGLFSNPNNASYYLAVVSVALIVEVLYAEKKAHLVWDILLLAAATAMDYYSNSRSGPLAVLCAAGLGVSIYLLTHKRQDNFRCLLRLCAGAAASVICISGLLYVFQLRDFLPLPYYNVQTQELYLSPRWESLYHPDPAPSGPSTPNTPSTPSDPVTPNTPNTPSDPATPSKPGTDFFGTDGFENLNQEKTEIGDKTADSFSTGRISIWKAYAKDLNLWGHESTPAVYIDILQRDITSTHMTILQVGYESGIIAGILYLLMNLTSGIGTILFAWKHRSEKYALMPLMLTVTFGVLSMLGSCHVAFWHWTTIMYYFVLFPIMAAVPSQPKLSAEKALDLQ